MEIVLFSDPFYNHIIDHLNPVDLYNLCQTCKYYRSSIKKHYFEKATIKEMRRRMVLLFYTSENRMNECLTNCNKIGGVITGSFIIQCVLGEYWNDQIDHYFPNSAKLNSKIEKFRLYENNPFSEFYSKYYVVPNKSSISLKLVVLNSDNVHNFIENTFDFNICKNKYWYDGKDNISIHSINEILSKKATFGCKTVPASSIERRDKYVKRGFIFDESLSYEKIIHGLSNSKEIQLYKMIANNNVEPIIIWSSAEIHIASSSFRLIDIDSLNLVELERCRIIKTKCDKDCIILMCGSKINHIHGENALWHCSGKMQFLFIEQ